MKAKLILISLLTFMHLGYTASLGSKIDGIWITKDDASQQKRSIVKLETVNNEITGVIEKVFPQPGDTGICRFCPGELKGKPITGLKFLWGLKAKDANSWDGGHILDPKSGKVYKLRMTLKGDKLYVRGYIGVSFLGRTQVWTRE